MNKSNKPQRVDIYQKVTDLVIAELEKGCAVWRQSWGSQGMPQNVLSRKNYRGWNALWLGFVTLSRGYSQPYFLTFKQAQAKGGTVRKGEHGYPVVFWATKEKKAPQQQELPVSENENVGVEKYRFLKTYTVFNIDQTEGVDFAQTTCAQEQDRIVICEQVVEAMPQAPRILFDSKYPYYQPTLDQVHMPPLQHFSPVEEYYSTLFHELAHSTGHASRLNREELTNSSGFGTERYSKEELTAEMAAAMLCGYCGIAQTIPNSAAYIGGWLAALKEDKTLLLRAASKAQAAADFILGTSGEQQPETADSTSETLAV